jgi:SagB-type dehydrogenase family enzyme
MSIQRRHIQTANPLGSGCRIFARVRNMVNFLQHGDQISVECGGKVLVLGEFELEPVGMHAFLGRHSLELAVGLEDEGSEVSRLVRRLAEHGLIEFVVQGASGELLATMLPQSPTFWPVEARLEADDQIVLSRFALIRRRGRTIILESPLSAAVIELADRGLMQALLALTTPRTLSDLEASAHPIPHRIVRILARAGILVGSSPREDGDPDLAMWDFQDMLFHTRSREGRHANVSGGSYDHLGTYAPLPGVRPPWRGEATQLDGSDADLTPLDHLLQSRRSTRFFDATDPITLRELSLFLRRTAHVSAVEAIPIASIDDSVTVEFSRRPYPSGGGSYEVELYLSVDRCEGLNRGFYHYDAGRHCLVQLPVNLCQLELMLSAARNSMASSDRPQVLINLAARFGRMSWKYRSIAYACILKNVGVLIQTFYLVATDMGLGGCAVGTGNIDLFSEMTGLDFHVEGSVGEFALGRGRLQD